MDDVIGSCSICGGNVVRPSSWLGTRAPRPKCESCGAIAVQRPVIPMVAAPRVVEIAPFKDSTTVPVDSQIRVGRGNGLMEFIEHRDNLVRLSFSVEHDVHHLVS